MGADWKGDHMSKNYRLPNGVKRPPSWVVLYVSSLLCGYSDREKYIELNPDAPRRIIDNYQRINRAIDDGLADATAPGERDMIFRSIRDMTGYERIYNYPGGRERFYHIKNSAIACIAKRMRIM